MRSARVSHHLLRTELKSMVPVSFSGYLGIVRLSAFAANYLGTAHNDVVVDVRVTQHFEHVIVLLTIVRDGLARQ